MGDMPTMVTGDLAFGADMQSALLVHIVHSKDLMRTAAAIPLQVRDFDLPACKVVYDVLQTHWQKYDKLPPVDVMLREVSRVALGQRLDAAEADPLQPTEFEALADLMQRILNPGELAVEYYRDELFAFIKNVRARRAHLAAADALAQGVGTDEFIRQVAELNTLDAETSEIDISDPFVNPCLIMDKRKAMGVTTGLSAVDGLLHGGLQNGENGLIISCTGVGKTCTLLNFTQSAAALGWHVLYINTEMRHPSLHHRLLGIAAHIMPNTLNLQTDQWSDQELRQLSLVMNSAYKGRVAIVDLTKTEPTLAAAEQAIQMWLRQKEKEGNRHKAKLVMLDHIGEIRPDKRYAGTGGDMDWKAYAGIMKDWTRIVRKYDLSSWIASQGTRESDGIKIIHKRHTAMASQMLWPVDIALGLAPKDPVDRYMIKELSDDDIGELGHTPCDRELVINVMKGRNQAGLVFTIYQGGTLRMYNRKAEYEHEDSIVKRGDFSALMPV